MTKPPARRPPRADGDGTGPFPEVAGPTEAPLPGATEIRPVR